MNVDPLSSSLYFSASALASKESQKNQDKSKIEKSRKTAFSSMVDKSREMEELAGAGLPIEIAGLSVEDAVVFLKDAVDAAADKLNDNLSSENFAEFRKSVSQFMRYVQKNNYEVTKIKRFGKRKVKGVFLKKRVPVIRIFRFMLLMQNLMNWLLCFYKVMPINLPFCQK